MALNAISFLVYLFKKIAESNLSNQFKTKVLSVLIWVQMVCKGNERILLVGKELIL